MKKIGNLKTKSSKEISGSKIGVGFGFVEWLRNPYKLRHFLLKSWNHNI